MSLERYRKTMSDDVLRSWAEDADDEIINLRNQIIDLKACLRACANAANGGLDQYSTTRSADHK